MALKTYCCISTENLKNPFFAHNKKLSNDIQNRLRNSLWKNTQKINLKTDFNYLLPVISKLDRTAGKLPKIAYSSRIFSKVAIKRTITNDTANKRAYFQLSALILW